MRLIGVTRDDLGSRNDVSSGIRLTGTDNLTGERVTFEADRENALDLIESVRITGWVDAQINDDQIVHKP